MQATVKFVFHNSSKCILRLYFQKHTWTRTHYHYTLSPHLNAHYIRPRKSCVFHYKKTLLDKPSFIVRKCIFTGNNNSNSMPMRLLSSSCSSSNGNILTKLRDGSEDENSLLSYGKYLNVISRRRYSHHEKNKVEETVKALKEASKAKEEGPTSVFEVKKDMPPTPVKKPLGQRIVEEVKHFYHGFRLLFIDIKVCTKLCWKVMLGYHLSRREHKLLVRTTADLFRLIPFSVFVIVPFMEFTLPFFLWLFPGMMPSTFQSKDSKDVKTKKELRLKLEMAKFLQDTLDTMSVQSKTGHDSELAQEFTQFCDKVRSTGRHVTNEEILKFSKLFEDELTLDNLSKEQLVALCRLLELQPIGTSKFLNFQLRMRLRNLKADDRVIKKEGLENMTIWEIQQACKARGMRSVGLTEDRLRAQLDQWLELSLKEGVPPSLLLLSRALYMPDQVATAEQIAATISQLPDKIAKETEAKIGEIEGKISNKMRLQLIQEEEKRIKAEIEEEEKVKKQEEQEKKLVEEKAKLEAQMAKTIVGSEMMVDRAPVLKDIAKPLKEEEKVTLQDLDDIELALGTITSEKKPLHLEKEELAELKEEMAEYKEDIEELKEVIVQTGRSETELKESKAASRLSKKVDKMINKLDKQITKEEEKAAEKAPLMGTDKEGAEIITINELMENLKKYSKHPDETRLKNISKILQDMDIDHDGNIKVDDVVKVLEVLGSEQSTITTKHMKEVIEMIEKEENLEMVEKIEKVMHREAKPGTSSLPVTKPKAAEKMPPPPLQ